MTMKDLLKQMIEKKASDLFYRAGGTPRLRIDGKLVDADDKVLSIEQAVAAVDELTTAQQKEEFRKSLDIDFALYLKELGSRFRISIFMQRNWPSLVIRSVRDNTQAFEELNLPAEVLKKLALESRGLVLLTGSMGSGKSTTIASMIEYMNNNVKRHILTVEEPIEFTFRDKLSLINQRELGIDVSSYAAALRAFTLQSPDVMFIGNIRDQETMSAAITAAETGVLVLSTLHTLNTNQNPQRIL